MRNGTGYVTEIKEGDFFVFSQCGCWWQRPPRTWSGPRPSPGPSARRRGESTPHSPPSGPAAAPVAVRSSDLHRRTERHIKMDKRLECTHRSAKMHGFFFCDEFHLAQGGTNSCFTRLTADVRTFSRMLSRCFSLKSSFLTLKELWSTSSLVGSACRCTSEPLS